MDSRGERQPLFLIKGFDGEDTYRKLGSVSLDEITKKFVRNEPILN